MEKHARTSQGTIRRFIDISSYWSHAYLMEDMSIVGKADLKESFMLDNLPAGKDILKDWWRLFLNQALICMLAELIGLPGEESTLPLFSAIPDDQAIPCLLFFYPPPSIQPYF